MNDMKKYHSWMWGVVLALFLIAAFIGPVIINWLYKIGPGWVTMWKAPDMLSYYGTVLGAVVTAFSLILTILFTRKQIERNRFLERNLARWNRIEAIFAQALIDISPLSMRSAEVIDENTSKAIYTRIAYLQTYSVKALTALDGITSYASPEEYKKIESCVNEIQTAVSYFCDIDEELISLYMQLLDLMKAGNGRIDDNAFDAGLKQINETFKKVPQAHIELYRGLLTKKRIVFDKIYADIEDEASQMLLFKRRKNNANS